MENPVSISIQFFSINFSSIGSGGKGFRVHATDIVLVLVLAVLCSCTEGYVNYDVGAERAK